MKNIKKMFLKMAPYMFSPGFEISRKIYLTPVGQKLRKEKEFLDIGCFGARTVPLRLADLTPPLKNYLLD
jgi:hypothetical protein